MVELRVTPSQLELECDDLINSTRFGVLVLHLPALLAWAMCALVLEPTNLTMSLSLCLIRTLRGVGKGQRESMEWHKEDSYYFVWDQLGW